MGTVNARQGNILVAGLSRWMNSTQPQLPVLEVSGSAVLMCLGTELPNSILSAAACCCNYFWLCGVQRRVLSGEELN